MKQELGSDQMTTEVGVEDVGPWMKPGRLELYAEGFYCPLIYLGGNAEVFSKYEPLPEFGETPPSSVSVGKLTSDSSKENETDEASTTTDIPNDDILNSDHSNDPNPDMEIEDKVEDVIPSDVPAVKLTTELNLAIFHAESIQVPCVEMKDICTSISQPSFNDAAAGNSQPCCMVDCATGMSQNLDENNERVDVGIQTSQEWQSVDKPLLSKCEISVGNENEIPHSRKRHTTKGTNLKTPIVFPRVSCQTVAPEIPAKIPRLSELDQNIVMNPIYSSGVTFDFDEVDKENDKSVLRQRGNVGKLMRETSCLDSKYPSPSKRRTQSENMSNENFTPFSNLLNSSRGPFLRVGLSKKSRRTPLHPRIFDTESQD